MKYKVEGESGDGHYLDGQSFDTEQDALQEVLLLSQEFPDNSYWVDIALSASYWIMLILKW